MRQPVRASVAHALDDACVQALQAGQSGREVAVLRVGPSLYAEFARAKARELTRGEPLMVLGLRVVMDDEHEPPVVE